VAGSSTGWYGHGNCYLDEDGAKEFYMMMKQVSIPQGEKYAEEYTTAAPSLLQILLQP
jgi:hypothetical protein